MVSAVRPECPWADAQGQFLFEFSVGNCDEVRSSSREREATNLQQIQLNMKILVVGGTGTIGSAVVNTFAEQHEVTVVGHTSGDVQVDLSDPDSIDRLYETVGA